MHMKGLLLPPPERVPVLTNVVMKTDGHDRRGSNKTHISDRAEDLLQAVSGRSCDQTLPVTSSRLGEHTVITLTDTSLSDYKMSLNS